MAIEAGIGFNQDPDPIIAAQEAAREAKQQLQRQRIDLALVFNTTHYEPNIFLPILHKELQQTKLLGCSTSGVILPNRTEPRGIGVLAIYSDSTHFETSVEGHLNLQDLGTEGERLIKQCSTDYGHQQRKILFLLADGLLNNFSDIIAGTKRQLPDDLPIIGAGSSDKLQFDKTYQYFNDTVLSNGALGLLISGKTKIAASCKHGWRPLGKPHSITKIDKNIIQKIDGKPALNIFQQYLPEESKIIGTSPYGDINARYPLGIKTDFSEEYILRHALSCLDDGGIICQDTVTTGQNTHLMINSAESCLQAAAEAANDIKTQLAGHPPRLLLVIESAYRNKVLTRDIAKEITIIKNTLTTTRIFGMQSYGEIFTYRDVNNAPRTEIQNGSIVLLAFA